MTPQKRAGRKSPKKSARSKAYPQPRDKKIQWREQRQLWLASTDAHLYTLRSVQYAYDTMGKRFKDWLADEVDRVNAMTLGRHLSGEDD